MHPKTAAVAALLLAGSLLRAAPPPPARSLLEHELRALDRSSRQARIGEARKARLRALLEDGDRSRRVLLQAIVGYLEKLEAGFAANPEHLGSWTGLLPPLEKTVVTLAGRESAKLVELDRGLSPTQRTRILKRFVRRNRGEWKLLPRDAFQQSLLGAWKAFYHYQQLSRPALVGKAEGIWAAHEPRVKELLARYRKLRPRILAVDLKGRPTSRGRILTETRELAYELVQELRSAVRGYWDVLETPEQVEVALAFFSLLKKVAWVVRRYHPVEELDWIP